MKKVYKLIFISCFVALVVIFTIACIYFIRISGEMKARCQYISETSYFTAQIKDFLKAYYVIHKCYPQKIDFSQFSLYKNEQYQKIIQDIDYLSDGYSFNVVWRYPTMFGADTFEIWECEGKDGKIIQYKLSHQDAQGNIETIQSE